VLRSRIIPDYNEDISLPHRGNVNLLACCNSLKIFNPAVVLRKSQNRLGSVRCGTTIVDLGKNTIELA
jgi:hypothetical protein